MENVTKIFTAVSEERSQALKAAGIDESTFGKLQKADENLYRLSEVLKIFIKHRSCTSEEESFDADALVSQVAWEMGVGGIDVRPAQYNEAASVGKQQEEGSLPS